MLQPIETDSSSEDDEEEPPEKGKKMDKKLKGLFKFFKKILWSCARKKSK